MLVLVFTAVPTIVVAICYLIGTKIKSGVVDRALKQGTRWLPASASRECAEGGCRTSRPCLR